MKKAISHRVRIDMVKLDHFLTFVTDLISTKMLLMVNEPLKLESGERSANALTSSVPLLGRSTMIAQYLAFCEDDGFQPLSRATMYRRP